MNIRQLSWLAATFVLVCARPVPAEDLPPDDPRLTPVVRAYQRVRPAVVNISADKIVSLRYGWFDDGLFSDIFGEMFPKVRRHVPVRSLGSGFVINPAGYIITNAHVVLRAEKITVTMADGSEHEAAKISSDPDHDLAVLKIDPPAGKPLPYLPLGRSDDLMVGETVIVIGNPLGYANSLTTGVISALGRDLAFGDEKQLTGLIQTDAPINRGNSGGPLLNIKGELIGVNTAIRADAQNIGFAIPADRLAERLAGLLDTERLNRVVFGAVVRQQHGPAGDQLCVTEVRQDTPAYGKLRPGDRIVTLDGLKVRQISDFACAMADKKPGSTVRLGCLRDGKELVLEVTLTLKPRPDGNALARKHFGLRLRELTPSLARDLRLAVDRGLVVVGVEGNSPADRLGMDVKDVLLQVGGFYVKDLDDLGLVLENVRPGQRVQLVVVRRSVVYVVSIIVRRDRPGVGL